MDNHKTYLGYYVTVFVIISCIVFSIVQINSTKDTHNKKMENLKELIEESITNRVNNSVSIGKTYTDIDTWIRIAILENPFEAKKESMENQNRLSAYKKRAGYNEYINMDIYKIIIETNFNNKEKQVETLCNETNAYITKENPFLINSPLIKIWSLVSISYLIIIFFMYKNKKITVGKEESLLSTIDLGFYFALIQFTGGFNTFLEHKIILISFVISVVIIEINIIVKDIKKRFSGGIIQAIKNSDIFTVFRDFYPIVLFTIALLSGLIWATITPDNCGLKYWSMYVFSLFIMSVFAIGIYSIIFFLANIIFNKNQI